MRLVVVRTGMANLASVLAAFRRLGVEPEVSTDPHVVGRADRLVLPGVGAFGAAMQVLRDTGLVEPIAAHVASGRPLFAVCLGLQVLCEGSEESPGVPGLGIVEGLVQRFPAGVLVPQLGWNLIRPTEGSRHLVPGHAYYANSYRLPRLPEGWEGATSDHGGSFVAALERGNLLACQFHPELSGVWGRRVIARWLEAEPVCESAGAPC